MTVETLRRLRRLDREIERGHARLSRLQADTQREQRRRLDNIRRRDNLRRRLSAYLNGVDDAQMRSILALRYLDGLSWWEVADRIGGGNTADGVRMAHVRFLRAHPPQPHQTTGASTTRIA